MQQRIGYTGITARGAAQDLAGLLFGAFASAGVVAGVAMGMVYLLA